MLIFFKKFINSRYVIANKDYSKINYETLFILWAIHK